jgi:hypothetical protein
VSKSLTVWITPFTGLSALDEAISKTQQLANSAGKGWAPSLLLPTNFGPWPQSQCTQSLPSDMLVSAPDDVASIRQRVEAASLGFGIWFVPVNVDDSRAPDVAIPELCAQFAWEGGYAVGNWEPDSFWRPGDDPAAIDEFWTRFWNSLPDQDAMSGNVAATVVPNQWGLSSFSKSLTNLAAGCGALCLEVYGGLQTPYPYPDLWPSDGFMEVRNTGVNANLIPILATANLSSQIVQANRLGHGNVHVWAI